MSTQKIIKLEAFEGPLALLLHLIEKHQVDIYDIPIAEVTEQYLAYLKAMEEFDIDIASEFLVMAATLLQIKSRMLLPKPPKIDEIVEEEEDPRQALVERLLEYRKFKQVSLMFEDMIRQREQFFSRMPQELPVKIPLPEEIKLDELIMAFAAVWESAVDDYALIAREEFSVSDKMHDIMYLLHQNNGKLEFSQTIFRSGTRSELVVAFLATLELIRLKRVSVEQEKNFGPIYIVLRESAMS